MNEETRTVCYDWIVSIANEKSVKLNEKYWTAEWSWSPICDGIFAYEQTPRTVKIYQFKDNNGWDKRICIYETGTNYRKYFAHEFFKTKEECEVACRHFNAWGYDYDISRGVLIKWLEENAELMKA